MRRSPLRALLAALVAVAAGGCAGLGPEAGGPPPQPAGSSEAARLVEHLPLSFRPAGAGRYVAQGAGYGVTVSAQEAVVSGTGAEEPLRMRLVGARADAPPAGHDRLAARTNLLLGDDPEGWRVDVPSYAKVGYAGVWDGVDVVYHARGHRLEYDFLVAPGAHPGAIDLSFDGASDVRLGHGGDLVVVWPGGHARMAAPVLYQADGRSRRPVAGGFDLRGGNRVGFRVGTYDTGRPLVIDPVLDDSTLLGGAGNDTAYAVAIDAAGAVYVAGSTESADFPVDAPLQRNIAGGAGAGGPRVDVFVAKIDPATNDVVYSTYLGGAGRDVAYALAVGSDGSAYVAGETASSDFPLARPVQKASGGGPGDGFLARLGPQGAVLQFSTYLGGGAADSVRGIAVDQVGDAYVIGSTNSGNFPIAGAPLKNAQSRPDDSDAFVAKINAAGSAWLYSTYLGGGDEEHGLGIAVDREGNAYVVGDTRSVDFPVANAFQAAPSNPQGGADAPDAFVSKLAPTGSPLVYSTYLGGRALDQAAGIAVDEAGSAYVTGNTRSDEFAVGDVAQKTRNGDSDAFVAKLAPTGGSIAYSTYVGGGGSDTATDVAVDGEGRASVTGSLTSTNLRTVDAVQPTRGGGFLDGFVATLDASGAKIVRSTYLGGRGSDQGLAIAVDFDGTVVVAGLTTSSDFPVAEALQQRAGGGGGDAFLSRVGRPVPGAGESGTSSGDRRAQALLVTTVLLFLAAVTQTLWLRRRARPGAADELPTPVWVPGAAAAASAANPDDQAAWIAKADQAVRATGFPSVQVPRPDPPPPFRTRRRPVPVEDGGAPTVEVPVPDLLAEHDDDGPGAPGPETPAEEVSPTAVEVSATAPPVDLSDPDLLGGSGLEPAPEFPSDPDWWDLLIEEEANASRSAQAPPEPAPTGSSNGGGEDWAADLWAAGMVATPPPSSPPVASPEDLAPPSPTPEPAPAPADVVPAGSAEDSPSPPPPPPPPPPTGASVPPPPEQPPTPSVALPPSEPPAEPPTPTPPAAPLESPPAGPRPATAAPGTMPPAEDSPDMPPLDAESAAALVEELSLSDLLDEELPIPDRPSDEPEELSLSDLLDEELPIPEPARPEADPDASPGGPPAPSTPAPPPAPPSRPSPPPEPGAPSTPGIRRPEPPTLDRPATPRPLPEAAPAGPTEADREPAEPPDPAPETPPVDEDPSPSPPSRPLPEAAPGQSKPERAWPRWRPRR